MSREAGLNRRDGFVRVRGAREHNLKDVDVEIPRDALVVFTGVSGSGKSSLAFGTLYAEAQRRYFESVSPYARRLIDQVGVPDVDSIDGLPPAVALQQSRGSPGARSSVGSVTTLSSLVRLLYSRAARTRRYDAGRFSFNVAKGRCETCEGEGFVSVELLFMPSVYAPCPTCHGARYNAETLEVTWHDETIADVLGLTVDDACAFFIDEASVLMPLALLRDIGLGYLRLGQPATELSGGEAQRIKLATELQKQQRGRSLYVLDEPTTGLHPADVDKLLTQLQGLVDAGNTVIVVEHDERVVAACDWVVEIGPGAGAAGGRVVSAGPPPILDQFAAVVNGRASSAGGESGASELSGCRQARDKDSRSRALENPPSAGRCPGEHD